MTSMVRIAALLLMAPAAALTMMTSHRRARSGRQAVTMCGFQPTGRMGDPRVSFAGRISG